MGESARQGAGSWSAEPEHTPGTPGQEVVSVARSQACHPVGREGRGQGRSPRETLRARRHRARPAEQHTMRLPVKPHNLDRRPGPPTRRGSGEVPENIGTSLTRTNVIDHEFLPSYPPPGGSGTILHRRRSAGVKTVTGSPRRQNPSRTATSHSSGAAANAAGSHVGKNRAGLQPQDPEPTGRPAVPMRAKIEPDGCSFRLEAPGCCLRVGKKGIGLQLFGPWEGDADPYFPRTERVWLWGSGQTR